MRTETNISRLNVDRETRESRRALFAGFSGIFVGIGLARFAYAPLLPAVIAAGWFSVEEAGYLGAANLAGYLGGALAAPRIGRSLPSRPVLRSMMLLAFVSIVACALPVSFLWFFAWRFLSGLSGGVVMVLATSVVMRTVRGAQRGVSSGVLFSGVGLGVIASGALVPYLAATGPTIAWLGVGALGGLFVLFSWWCWPVAPEADGEGPALAGAAVGAWIPMMSLCVLYALIAAGLVPHMVFLVDFIARGLGRGLQAGGQFWLLFGIGALLGPIAVGTVADRIGFRAMLRLGLMAQAVCVGMLALPLGSLALAASSLVIGAFVPANVSLVVGRIQELLPASPHRQKVVWGYATACFAVGQAAAGYGFSYLLGATGSHRWLFGIGGALFVGALTIELVSARFAGGGRVNGSEREGMRSCL